MKKMKKAFAMILAFAIVCAGIQIPTNVYAAESNNLADVISSAGNAKTIVLNAEGAYVEENTTVTIPEGVTLIVPHKSGVKNADGANPNGTGTKADTAYSTLEIKDGGKLVVNGDLIVASQSGYSGTSHNVITGAYAEIVTGKGSTIEVHGTLTNYGIISGAGELVAQSGAQVTDLYTAVNFRGGTYTLNVAQYLDLYPINETGCDNIQIKSTYYEGSSLKGSAKIYFPSMYLYVKGEFTLIGEDGIYRPGNGGNVTKELVGEIAAETSISNEVITFKNGGTMSDSTLKIFYFGTQTINSKYFLFPITGKTKIVVESETLNIERGFKFLPGAVMEVNEGATLLLNEDEELRAGSYTNEEEATGYLVFYAGGNGEGTFGAAEKSVGSTKYSSGSGNAKLVVNGTLKVENNGYIVGDIDATNGKVLLPCETDVDEEVTFTSYESPKASYTEGMALAPVKTSLTWKNVENVTVANHSLGEATINKATCTVDGSSVSTCTVCGEIVTEVLKAPGHTEVIDEAVKATCVEDGKTEGSHCSVCGEVLVAQDTIVARGYHNMVESSEAIEPTCTTPGYSSGQKCTDCDHVEGNEETEPALGHVVVTDAAVAPTCTAEGKTEGSHCSRCGEVLVAQEVVPALGHDIVIDAAVEPTCTVDGKTEGSHCSRCDEVTVKQEVVPALGHVVVTDAAVEPTCTVDGKTEGSHCSECGEVLVAQEVVSALGHVVVTDAAVEATCTADGKTEGSHCSRCDEVLVAQEVVPATGHTGEWVVEKEATETEDGLKTRECEVCGETEEEVIKFQPVVSDGANNTEKEDSNNGAVKTGDESNVTMLLGVCALALGVILYLKRRRAEMA